MGPPHDALIKFHFCVSKSLSLYFLRQVRVPCPLHLSLPPKVLATLRKLLEKEDSPGAAEHCGG